MDRMLKYLEIPVTDLGRASSFYKSIFDIDIFIAEMLGYSIGFFRKNGADLWVAIAYGKNYFPSDKGGLAYLNAGMDVQLVLDKVIIHGGAIITPKTLVSDEIGYMGIIMDTEGNRIGIHYKE
jgi:predicted enzyme related to lactoylglutathione lyase